MSVSPLLVVQDLERSVRFYRRLGFVTAVHTTTYAKLSWGSGTLHLAAGGDAPADRPGIALQPPAVGSAPTALVVIEVPDCRAYCHTATDAGIELVGPPAVPDWGGEVRAFLLDPDGHLVEINQPTGPAETH